jgi:hypothetical protein
VTFLMFDWTFSTVKGIFCIVYWNLCDRYTCKTSCSWRLIAFIIGEYRGSSTQFNSIQFLLFFTLDKNMYISPWKMSVFYFTLPCNERLENVTLLDEWAASIHISVYEESRLLAEMKPYIKRRISAPKKWKRKSSLLIYWRAFANKENCAD